LLSLDLNICCDHSTPVISSLLLLTSPSCCHDRTTHGGIFESATWVFRAIIPLCSFPSIDIFQQPVCQIRTNIPKLLVSLIIPRRFPSSSSAQTAKDQYKMV